MSKYLLLVEYEIDADDDADALSQANRVIRELEEKNKYSFRKTRVIREVGRMMSKWEGMVRGGG